jgi:hypothetical protein
MRKEILQKLELLENRLYPDKHKIIVLYEADNVINFNKMEYPYSNEMEREKIISEIKARERPEHITCFIRREEQEGA